MMNMNNTRLHDFFETMTPDEAQKMKILEQVESGQLKKRTGRRCGRPVWITATAAGLVALAIFCLQLLPVGPMTATAYAVTVDTGTAGAEFKIMDNLHAYEYLGVSVSNINTRPDLEFYINGEDIAKIELVCENEFLYVVDWTETQEERYWNTDIWQQYDEATGRVTTDYSLLYEKRVVVAFDETFDAYDGLWYRWTAQNLLDWASQDDYAHILGAGLSVADLSEEEKLHLASGEDTAIGHIQLEGYPAELLRDSITITVTDRQGRQSTSVIDITISNNEMLQTVVTAELREVR